MKGIMGKKLGMTQIFKEDGTMIPVTVVEAKPMKIVAIKTVDKDGYNALQVGFDECKEKVLTKTKLGLFKKAGVTNYRHLIEFENPNTEELKVGDEWNLSIFADGEKVTVTGLSKGRGFAGTIKRHGFSRGPETHGSKNVREPGSQSAHSYPARVFPGKKGAGHMGDAKVTVRNLNMAKIDLENNLMFIQGALPGPKNSKVIIRKISGKANGK